MPQKTGSPVLEKPKDTAIKSLALIAGKKSLVCKVCNIPIQRQTTYAGVIQSKICTTCLRAKQKEKRERNLTRLAERKQKNREKKLRTCLDCLERPREKNKNRCRTCRLKNDVQYWSKKAWGVFSEYIRRRSAAFNDYVACYTCRKQFLWKQLNAGHFDHRGRERYKAIDFEPKHIQAQCVNCNKGKNGEQFLFGKHLEEDYGKEWPEQIRKRRATELPLTIPALQEKIEFYQTKLKEL